MSRRLRRASLTLHVLSSVGWFGAVGVFLALSVVAVGSDDGQVVEAAYVTMGWAGGWVLVPLAAASLTTGVVEGLTTRWGLVRHYWVLFKLLLTLAATVVLVLYTRTLSVLAADAVDGGPELDGATVVVHSGAALVLLVAATVLAVFKPRGRTGWGRAAGGSVTVGS